jgi:hypothetical protein
MPAAFFAALSFRALFAWTASCSAVRFLGMILPNHNCTESSQTARGPAHVKETFSNRGVYKV